MSEVTPDNPKPIKRKASGITALLHTAAAKAIYKHVAKRFSKMDLESFMFPIANYCNELALYHRIEKQLAELDELTVDYTNNKNKTNEKKHELTRARKESAELLLKWQAALELTPSTRADAAETFTTLQPPPS